MDQTQTLPPPAGLAQPHVPVNRRSLLVPAVVALCVLAWLVARSGWYTPGSDFGYYLGLVGAVMMLVLLLYPLRKHLRFMQYLGAMRHWFRLHMLLGIGGPLLILLHSTFRIGSLNAGVAMACMILVAGSGIVGRFIYTRIHHGLYGRRASVQELQAQLGLCEGEVHSKFHFAPEVEKRLTAFGVVAHTHATSALSNIGRVMTLGLRARHVRRKCRRDLKRILGAHAAQRSWPRDKLRGRVQAADQMVAAYLEAVHNAAHFGVYERLFSLWHVLHVPFVFMLVISGVVHVIAVHMY
jgi:hypothetical protein